MTTLNGEVAQALSLKSEKKNQMCSLFYHAALLPEVSASTMVRKKNTRNTIQTEGKKTFFADIELAT